MKKIWNDFALLWSLITRIRIPKIFMPETFSLPSAGAMVLLPLAGGLFGLAAAVPARIAAAAMPPSGAAWIASAVYIIFGWSLHLDGWGDLWDGIGSGKRGETLRSVMKDSRVGAFGVAGITIAIGTRTALLADIAPPLWLASCVISCGIGRFGSIAAMYLGEYPWPEGMARNIVKDFTTRHLALSFAAACVMIPVWPAAWAVGMAASCAGGAALAFWGSKNLGGVNGDVIGAAAVLGEILTMAGCAALE